MENNNIYEVRVIPFVTYVKKVINGKVVEDAVDTFTREERLKLSCECPSMLWENREHVYLAEAPLYCNEGTGIRRSLYYMFDKLTKEEQEKYFDRSIIIKMSKPEEVKVYGDESKRFFGKRKIKERK